MTTPERCGRRIVGLAMTRKSIIPAMLLAATACQVQQPSQNESSNTVDASTEALPAPATDPSQANGAAAAAAISPELHVDPDAPPPPAETSALGAARRLLQYCDAVATKRYRDAYALWSDNGRASGMSLAQFGDSFAKYAAYDCHIGEPGDPEGAAGSIYVIVPLRVTGALTRGGGFVLEGPVTMRRVNDVPGSTAEQRRWHISASGLAPRP